MPVVISSYALSTPFGDAEQTFRALADGRFLIDSTRIDLRAAGDHRVTALALHVARQVMASTASSVPTALIVGTSKGEVDRWLEIGKLQIADCRLPIADCQSQIENQRSTIKNILPLGLHEIAATVQRELALSGPALTVSAACASGLFALARGVLMLQAGEAQRVLVVAAESSFHPLLLASYRRLGVLAADGTGCRPLDHDRSGFFVGEAAAAVLLEHGELADGIIVDGIALGSDAASITAPNPSPHSLADMIVRATGGRPVDLIHAHATGTIMNDPIELAAIDLAAGRLNCRPVVYSHKGAIGHTLGASGLVSIVLNCLMHQKGLALPNARCTRPLPAGNVRMPTQPIHCRIKRSLAISSGFGGPTAAAVLHNAGRGPRADRGGCP
jgi:3-oxoacyl-[acyl-carrier-protein] synthase II